MGRDKISKSEFLPKVNEMIKEWRTAKYIHNFLYQNGIKVSYVTVANFVNRTKRREIINNGLKEVICESAKDVLKAHTEFLNQINAELNKTKDMPVGKEKLLELKLKELDNIGKLFGNENHNSPDIIEQIKNVMKFEPKEISDKGTA